MGKRMCEKMGEKRRKGKREIAIYRVRSPRQTAKNDVKYPKVRHKKMSLHRRQADKDNYLGISSS
jgi:hypothetical protein